MSRTNFVEQVFEGDTQLCLHSYVDFSNAHVTKQEQQLLPLKMNVFAIFKLTVDCFESSV